MESLSPETQQWDYIKFKIQLFTGSSNIQIISIQKSNLQFDQTFNNLLKIDAAIDATNLTEQQIQRYRLKTNSTSIFQNGYIEQSNVVGSIHRILLFKLAICHILPVMSNGDKQLGFPQGYDTIYLVNQKQQLNLFKHQFLVNSAKQYSLTYDIAYKYVDKSSKVKKQRQLCQYCKNRAQIYCIQDKQFYCNQCFKSNHRSRQKQSHIAQQINQFNSVSFCEIADHLNNRKSYYCSNCRKTICYQCVKQNHLKHETMQIIELATKLQEKQNFFLKELKTKVHGLISQIEIKIASLTKQLQSKEQQIFHMFKTKISKLREDYMKKNSKMVGLHSLLRNKYDQYVWIEKFVGFSSDLLPAEDNIIMKTAFRSYLQNSSPKQFFNKVEKLIANFE